jgi:hypothetical protein
MSLEDENLQVLALVQATLGCISPNFQAVSLETPPTGVRLHFVLEAESSEDREEIEEIAFEFEAMQERTIKIEIELAVDSRPLHELNVPGRKVYLRKESSRGCSGPNLRVVVLCWRPEAPRVVRLHFVLEEENAEDREEIAEIVGVFELALKLSARLESVVTIDARPPEKFVPPQGRRVFQRRSWVSGRPRTIKLMWNYQCWPLWEPGSEHYALDPDGLGLSQETRERLARWATIPDAKHELYGRVPVEEVWTEEKIERLETEGRELWRILRSELGPGFRVLYHSSTENRVLRPEQDPIKDER